MAAGVSINRVPPALPQSPAQRSYNELRVQTLLQLEIIRLLQLIAGPAAPLPGLQDLSADVDNLRNDPDFQR